MTYTILKINSYHNPKNNTIDFIWGKVTRILTHIISMQHDMRNLQNMSITKPKPCHIHVDLVTDKFQGFCKSLSLLHMNTASKQYLISISKKKHEKYESKKHSVVLSCHINKSAIFT